MKKEPTVKKSIYFDASTQSEIEALGRAHVRTRSEQIKWLVTLGLKSSHLINGRKTPSGLDEGRMKRCFYAEPPLARRIDAIHRRLNGWTDEDIADGAEYDGRIDGPWSYSAVTRELLELGLKIERWVAAKIEVAGARLAIHGHEARGGTMAFGLKLVTTKDVPTLMMMRDTDPPASELLKWGLSGVLWAEAVARAIEARSLLESLCEFEDKNQGVRQPGPGEDGDS